MISRQPPKDSYWRCDMPWQTAQPSSTSSSSSSSPSPPSSSPRHHAQRSTGPSRTNASFHHALRTRPSISTSAANSIESNSTFLLKALRKQSHKRSLRSLFSRAAKDTQEKPVESAPMGRWVPQNAAEGYLRTTSTQSLLGEGLASSIRR